MLRTLQNDALTVAVGSFIALLLVVLVTWSTLIRYRSVLGGRLARMRRIMRLYSSGLEEYGWYVELDGMKAAKLTACYDGHGDFCYRYLLRPMTADPEVARDILDGGFWDDNTSRITFRSRLTKQRRPYDSLIRGGFHMGPNGAIEVYFRNLGFGDPNWTLWDLAVSRRWRKRVLARRRRLMVSCPCYSGPLS